MQNDVLPEVAKNDLTEQRFVLKARAKYFKTHVDEDIGKGNRASYARELALLIPEHNDQGMMFLAAWLPDEINEKVGHEVTGFVKAPIFSPCRFSVHRGPDRKSEQHYLFVMSKGVEELMIERLREGDAVEVQIYRASEDSEADGASDGGGNYHQV